MFSHFIFITTLLGSFYPHLTHEKTGAHRTEVTHPDDECKRQNSLTLTPITLMMSVSARIHPHCGFGPYTLSRYVILGLRRRREVLTRFRKLL